ncbi:MAG: NAD(P)-binding protein, partial [Solirubrobacteraceae bacterium]
MEIAVVGGGITGLVAARHLGSQATATQPLHITLLEETSRLGGRIQSLPFAGTTVDVGPEALFTMLPAGIRLCDALGLGG